MDTKTVDVAGCARCGQSHAGVVFQPFTNPVTVSIALPPLTDDGEPIKTSITAYTHWAMCPRMAQPMLYGIKVVEPADESHAADTAGVALNKVETPSDSDGAETIRNEETAAAELGETRNGEPISVRPLNTAEDPQTVSQAEESGEVAEAQR